MRQIPGYPDPHALTTQPISQFIWQNKVHAVTSASLTREIGAGLPTQVAGVTEMVAATGTVVLPASTDTVETNGLSGGPLVTEGLNLPWENHGPALGADASLNFGLRTRSGRDVPGRALTGRIDSVDGNAADAALRVGLVDRVDQFKGSISLGPLHYMHPAPADGAAPMLMGLHPTYVTDRIARASKFYATPPLQTGRTVVSAPLMGSAWPERGTIQHASVAGSASTYPTYATAPWGLVVRNLEALWTPTFTSQASGKLVRPMFAHMLVAPGTPTTTSRLYLGWGDPGAHRIAVSITESLGVAVHTFNGPGDIATGGHTSLVNAPVTAAEFATGFELSVWITPAGHVTIRIGDRQVTGRASLTWTMTDTPLRRVHLYATTNGANIGGLQVGFSETVYDLHAWTRTAIIETNPTGQLRNIPALVNEDRLTLLKSQANAELAAMWIDEDGRFRYKSRERLLAAPVVDTITVDGINAASWSRTWDSVHEAVKVAYRQPMTSRALSHRVIVHEASGTTLEPGEVLDEIIAVPDDEDWIDVAGLKFLTDNDLNSLYRFNIGRDSWLAGVVEGETPEGENVSFPASYLYMSGAIHPIDGRSYSVSVTPRNLPANYRLVLRTPGWDRLQESKRGINTPLLRAKAKTTWYDRVVTGTTSGTPGTGEYEHDASWWVQDAATAQALADYLAEYTAKPRAVMSEVEVTPDDRRQLADVYRVNFGTDPDGEPYPTLKCLCVGIKDSITADNGPVRRTQNLQLQIIEVED